MPAPPPDSLRAQRPIRLLRIISRLNIGGPAIQTITLTRALEERGYATLLVRGREDAAEGTMDHLAAREEVAPMRLPSLRRDPGLHDLRALLALVRVLRRYRPQIVHTHAAKAGTLGRLATILAYPLARRRPALVHTYHGHSLTGYFSAPTAAVYRAIERLLAPATDRLVAVSAEVRDELVDLGVAPAEKFEVIPLGFDLSQFSVSGAERHERRRVAREALGIPPQALVVTLVARLVPIKRVDRFLRIANALGEQAMVWFVVVGDGELRGSLQAAPEAAALGDRLIWTGFRQDVPDLLFGSDVVVLTSDNEGTPVSLIEAHAAGLPVVSTRVGGVSAVVVEGESGFVVAREAEEQFARCVARLLGEPALRRRFGEAGAARVSELSLQRLVERLDRLYSSLLEARGTGAPARGARRLSAAPRAGVVAREPHEPHHCPDFWR